jgi:hypothetical protein
VAVNEAVDIVPEEVGRKITLPGLALALTTFATAGGILLYWMGAVARSAYLSDMGVSSDGFERTREYVVELGASALYFKAGDYIEWLGQSPIALLGMIIAIFCFCLCWLWPVPKRKKNKVSGRKRALFYSALIALTTPMASMILTGGVILLLGLPAVAGGSYGEQLALELKEHGCTEAHHGTCQDLWIGGKLMGKGSVVAESSSRIAFFNACTGRTDVMDVEGTVARSSEKQPTAEALQLTCEHLFPAVP